MKTPKSARDLQYPLGLMKLRSGEARCAAMTTNGLVTFNYNCSAEL